MGFGLNLPASGAVQGIMKVYLLNTTDATYNKGNIFDTIIDDMVLVFNDTVNIASGATSYNMTLSTNFTYGGNNVYVAYDWEQLSTPLTTALNYRANTLIASSIRRQASTTAPPAILTGTSSFRPELLWGVDKAADDFEVSTLYAKGKNALSYGTPETVEVTITNNGYLPANKMVSFNVSGANTFAANAMVSLASEADTTLTFTFTAANAGFNTIAVSVPADDITGNDNLTWVQEVTTNTFGYADTSTTNLSAVGYNTGSGLLLSQFELNGTAAVTDVRVRIGDNPAAVGNTVYAVVVDTSGTILAQSANLVLAAADIDTWVNFPITVQPALTNQPFLVGLAQTANTTTGYFPLAYQIEDPTRDNAYFTAALTGAGLSPITAGFRFMIEAVVDTPPTCPVPTNLAAAAGCDTASLSWDSAPDAVSSTIQWGPAGFTPGTGTILTNVSSPYSLTGLALGTSYDFWVLDSCSSGSTSGYTGPFTFTTDTLPVVSASATVVNVTGTDAEVDFNATGTGTSYAWDFGDGNSGTGATPTHNYAANGLYTVIVTATNDCGSTTDTIQVDIQGISIDEFGIGNISLYPNPNDGYFTVTGLTEFGNNATLEVVTLTGTIVYSEEIVANGSENFTIDVRGLAAGAYYVRVRSDNGIGTKPFVIRD
jgi:PKD repeat protein